MVRSHIRCACLYRQLRSCCWAARCWAARCVTAQEIVTQCRPISGPAQRMHVWTGPAYTVYTVRYTNRPFTHQRECIRNVSWPMTQSFLLRPSCDPLSSWSSRVDIKWRWTKTRVQYIHLRKKRDEWQLLSVAALYRLRLSILRKVRHSFCLVIIIHEFIIYYSASISMEYDTIREAILMCAQKPT